jgi:SAM-dependent methyltransferase
MYDFPGFPRWVPGGRALDIGCGNGRFMDRIQRHGWDVIGVDTSLAAAAAARESFGITVHVGTVEDAPIDDGSLDFVHMSHVIEHLPQPVATLRRVALVLRPGGRLYVETPNIDSLAFRWTREYWFALDAPRHLWLFGPATLRRALAECGFSVRGLRALNLSTFAWEATYRREQREGRMVPRRPSIEWRDRPRATVLGALRCVAGSLSPRFGDALSCWAELVAPSRVRRLGRSAALGDQTL